MVQESIIIQKENPSLPLTSETKLQFQGLAKWALIISSIGFVLIAAMIAAALANAIEMSFIRRHTHGASPLFIGAAYVIVGILLLLPTAALFQFGQQLKNGLCKEDPDTIRSSFSILKRGLQYGGLLVLLLGVFAMVGFFL